MNIQTLIILAVIAIILLALIIIIARSLRIKKSKVPTTKPAFKTAKRKIDNNAQVYIGNLAYGVTENDLRAFFQPYGAVGEVRIVKNSRTGRSKGFAFITYRNAEEVNQALAAHGKQLQGRRLVVRIAKTRHDG